MTVAPRQPQDRKPKAGTGLFSFDHNGETYTLPKPVSTVRAPKFMRANRRRSDLDLTWTIIEALADDDEDLLDVFDAMSEKEFGEISKRLGKLIGADDSDESLGESEAS
jgi:hypothetical protein